MDLNRTNPEMTSSALRALFADTEVTSPEWTTGEWAEQGYSPPTAPLPFNASRTEVEEYARQRQLDEVEDLEARRAAARAEALARGARAEAEARGAGPLAAAFLAVGGEPLRVGDEPTG